MTLSLAGTAGYHHGACPTCGKARWPTRKAAKQAAKALHPGHRLSPYACGEYFHYGHIPRAVVRGTLDRSEL